MIPQSNKIINEGLEFIIQFRNDISGFDHGIAIKQIKHKEESSNLIFRLKNEWEHTYKLSIKGIRKAHKLEVLDGKTSLFLEYIDGETLREAFKQRKYSLADFLRIAISASKTLGELHAEKIIHKDINSKNILIGETPDDITIIDLGISTRLNLKSDYLINPDRLEGSLAYISPEQTGRMNRVLDYRSDLYSLGIVFYELLASRLPFEAADAMEFIHCHIAKTPESLVKYNETVPSVLNDIVMKLLEKNAEERYQSAFGLKHDLEVILKMIETKNEIISFPLAQYDFSGKFHLNQKLYGREIELNTLLHSFDEVTQGETRVDLISGFSGVGKSSLVHEIYKPITERRGFFIEGKFDQFQRNIPYQGFILAFKMFTQQLLTENESSLEQWKFRLKNILGENASLITTLIPDLELIVGKHEKVAQLNPMESQNRFNYTFIHFIREIATADHPLVIFLDDMQWTDLASLDLLKQILLDETLQYVLMILAYRDNETPGNHPFIVMLRELQSVKNNFDSIRLEGLSEIHVAKFIEDSFNCESSKANSLARMIVKKTDGNPYFINEFLKSLYANDMIHWDAVSNQWKWDEAHINEMSVTDNVVHFLNRKLDSFSENTLRIMQYASCIGNKFNVATLSEIVQLPQSDVQAILNQLMQEGYIIPLYYQTQKHEIQECRFAHDGFQQAIYSSISSESKSSIHHEIGQYLYRKNSDKIATQELFEIVSHLNQGRSLISASNEKSVICKLNYDAGVQASLSNAHEDALHYYNQSIELLEHNHWSTQFDFSFALFLAKAEAEYMNLNIVEADRNIDLLLTKARTDIEKATLLERKLINYVTLGKHKEALQVSRQCLGMLGINIPGGRVGQGFVIVYELIKAKLLLRGKKPIELLDLPELSSEKGRLLSSILSQTVTPAYFYDLEFYVLLILIMVNFSMKNGNSKSSPHAYVSYGVLMVAMSQKYAFGYEIGEMSLKLNQKFYSAQVRGKLTANLIGGIYHWVLPLKEVYKEFYEGYKYSIEAGDFNYASMNVCTVLSLYLRSGGNLKLVYDEFIEYKNFIERTNDNKVIWEHKLYNFTIDELRGLISEKDIHEFETSFVDVMKTTNFNLGYFYTLRCMNYYFQGDISKANIMGKMAFKLHPFYRASPLESFCVFFGSMALAASYQQASAFAKLNIKSRLKSSVKQFTKWEKSCQENFSAFAFLLRAELARINNEANATITYYKNAIQEAHKNKITNIEALGYELLGKYCQQNNLGESTDLYLSRASELYHRWGATLKVKLLHQEFPSLNLLKDENSVGNLNETWMDTASSTFSSTNLDLATVMKASVALAGEVRFEDMLNALMKVLIENAGAQRGCFILEKEKELIENKLSSYERELPLYIGIPDEEDRVLPISLIQYVNRTKEVVVIDNASLDIRFSNDAYIIEHKPKSILCLPIIGKGILVGLLYLENNLVEGAFTANRIELLKLLSGQIAVSIENSLLYENLELKVNERTSQLTIEKKKSDDLLLNILPEEIAEELKQHGSSEAKLFENVTVMFTDFVNFTGISEQMSPAELVEELNSNFTAFDHIMEKWGLEKIKTIGDAYLAVCGIPQYYDDHAHRVVQASLEILDYLNQHDRRFKVRIGINSGAVVAGIVGVRKFAYDIWGDTVNTASRMESSGEPGKINISDRTYALIKNEFDCTARGKIDAKHKGLIEMYFVDKVKKI